MQSSKVTALKILGSILPNLYQTKFFEYSAVRKDSPMILRMRRLNLSKEKEVLKTITNRKHFNKIIWWQHMKTQELVTISSSSFLLRNNFFKASTKRTTCDYILNLVYLANLKKYLFMGSHAPLAKPPLDWHDNNIGIIPFFMKNQ